MTRLYGYAMKSKRLNDYTPDVRFERTSVISTISLDGEQAPFIFQGTLDGNTFTAYVEKILLPILKEGKTLIIDNLKAHKVERALKLIREASVEVKFLPTYSPDFNPIEMCWSKIKASLRKAKARNKNDLTKALSQALDTITKSDIIGYFNHCGYIVNN